LPHFEEIEKWIFEVIVVLWKSSLSAGGFSHEMGGI